MAFSDLTDEKAARWKETRRRGRASFVLQTGAVYGALMFLWSTGYSVFADGAAEAFGLVPLTIRTAAWAIGGVLFGMFMWWVQERAFARRDA